jgi:hypothetical protein
MSPEERKDLEMRVNHPTLTVPKDLVRELLEQTKPVTKLETGLRIESTPNLFEIWDGGHCFFRVTLYETLYGKKEIRFERGMNPFRLDMMKLFAAWLMRLPEET